MRNIEKDVAEWQNEGIIDQQTAAAIVAYEKHKQIPSGNTPLVIFAILGSILVALGISLMVAENWDFMSVWTKTAIAYCPMLLGQILVILAVYKHKNSIVWREASAAFLFLCTGATLGLISQTYQLQGTITSFLLLWMILVIPLMFLTRSNTAFLLSIAISTWYCATTYWTSGAGEWHYGWAFGATVLYLVWQILGKKDMRAVGMAAGFLLPISMTIALGTMFPEAESWAFIGYFALFQILLILFHKPALSEPRGWKAGLGVIGFCGILFLLFLSSFHWWLNQIAENLKWSDLADDTSAIIMLSALCILYVFLLFYPPGSRPKPAFVLLPFYGLILILSGINTNFAQILMNVLILLIAIWFIADGFREKNLLWLNTGLMIFSLLVILRFFDFQLSFFVRGISFLIIGAGFFVANRLLISARKEDEK